MALTQLMLQSTCRHHCPRRGYRLIELDMQGEAQRVWGLYGNGPTQLNIPLGLAFDGQRLWVADSENNRIQAYDIQ